MDGDPLFFEYQRKKKNQHKKIKKMFQNPLSAADHFNKININRVNNDFHLKKKCGVLFCKTTLSRII